MTERGTHTRTIPHETTLAALLAAGIACALSVALTSTAFAGGYGYGNSGGGYAPSYHPKAYYPPLRLAIDRCRARCA